MSTGIELLRKLLPDAVPVSYDSFGFQTNLTQSGFKWIASPTSAALSVILSDPHVPIATPSTPTAQLERVVDCVRGTGNRYRTE